MSKKCFTYELPTGNYLFLIIVHTYVLSVRLEMLIPQPVHLLGLPIIA